MAAARLEHEGGDDVEYRDQGEELPRVHRDTARAPAQGRRAERVIARGQRRARAEEEEHVEKADPEVVAQDVRHAGAPRSDVVE